MVSIVLTRKPRMEHRIERRCSTVYRKECPSVQAQRQRTPHKKQYKTLIMGSTNQKSKSSIIYRKQCNKDPHQRCATKTTRPRWTRCA